MIENDGDTKTIKQMSQGHGSRTKAPRIHFSNGTDSKQGQIRNHNRKLNLNGPALQRLEDTSPSNQDAISKQAIVFDFHKSWDELKGLQRST